MLHAGHGTLNRNRGRTTSLNRGLTKVAGSSDDVELEMDDVGASSAAGVDPDTPAAESGADAEFSRREALLPQSIDDGRADAHDDSEQRFMSANSSARGRGSVFVTGSRGHDLFVQDSGVKHNRLRAATWSMLCERSLSLRA